MVKANVHIPKHLCRTMAAMLLLLLSAGISHAQALLTLGNIAVCNDTTVRIPVTGTNLNNVGAITLFIRFDETAMKFHSIQNTDPQLTGIMVNSLTNPSRVAIVWSKVSGASFPNTLMMELKFTLFKQSGLLSFIDDSCEIADLSLPPQILAVQLANGSVYESIPAVATGPENRTVISQSTALFQVGTINSTGFVWQESRNNGVSWTDLPESTRYNGTHTNSLTIRNVPVSYDKYLYRCILHAHSCDVPSGAATLLVDSITGTGEETIRHSFSLTNLPNPFTRKTTLEYNVPETGWVSIKILSMTGQIVANPVEEKRSAGCYHAEDDFADLSSGIYFCRYVFKNQAGVRETFRKMIKLN